MKKKSPSKKRAPIFDIWDEIRREMNMTIDKMAGETGIDYKWLSDFFNDGILADQVYRVKKIEKLLGTEGKFSAERYKSERTGE